MGIPGVIWVIPSGTYLRGGINLPAALLASNAILSLKMEVTCVHLPTLSLTSYIVSFAKEDCRSE